MTRFYDRERLRAEAAEAERDRYKKEVEEVLETAADLLDLADLSEKPRAGSAARVLRRMGEIKEELRHQTDRAQVYAKGWREVDEILGAGSTEGLQAAAERVMVQLDTAVARAKEWRAKAAEGASNLSRALDLVTEREVERDRLAAESAAMAEDMSRCTAPVEACHFAQRTCSRQFDARTRLMLAASVIAALDLKQRPIEEGGRGIYVALEWWDARAEYQVALCESRK